MTCALCGAADAEIEGGLCPACDRLSSFFTKTLDKDSATGDLSGDEKEARAASTFAPGQSFGDRYTIVELVGAGGMGQVYKVIDRRLNRTVALKLIRRGLRAQIGALQRFRRELSLAQQVTHPNVCRVHDLGEVEGSYYIAMEFVTGQTLEDLIHSMGHLSARQTITIARQVCAGLGAIHAQSIVHRDLKPGNVMVDRSGHAVVMDFGMAYHRGDERLTSEGSVLGTLAYLSPEHARGHPTDVRSDIYALGVIFYEMLTGRRPPGDDGPLPLALREATERCPPPSQFLPEVPADLDAIVMRCLQRDPEARFANTAELDQALAHAAAALSTTLMPAAPSSGLLTPGMRRRRWVQSGALGIGVVALAVLVAREFLGPKPPPPPPRSVAFLPLSYEGPGETSWLKDVVPKALGDSLRRNEGVEIAPFASSHGFGPKEDARSVATQLGVDAVVAGQLAVRDQQVQVDLRLWQRDQPEGRVEHGATLDSVFGEMEPLGARVLRALGVKTQGPGAPRKDPRALESYLKGVAFLEGWDVERNELKAEEAFTAALRADDTFAEAHAGLAAALWRRYSRGGDASLVGHAQDEAKRAVALAPTSPEAHLSLGVVLLGQGKSAEAAEAFSVARKYAPADDAVCRQMARAYFNLGRNGEAEETYQQAIDLRPGYWENYNAKASFYLRTGRHREAKALYGKVIELRPLSIAAYNNKAAVHIMDGEFKLAEALLEAALQVGSNSEVHTNLAFVRYAQGRYLEAAEECLKAIDAGASRAEAYGSMGDAYRQARRLADAEKAYAQSIEAMRARLQVNPQDAVLRAWFAMILAGVRHCPESLGEAKQALDGRIDATGHYYAAVAYALCADRGKAVRETIAFLEGGSVLDIRTNPDLRVVRSDPQVARRIRESPALSTP